MSNRPRGVTARPERIVTQLEFARRNAGMSQTRLAAAARLHASDISRFENGWAKPFPGQASRLAKVLKIADAADLLRPASRPSENGAGTAEGDGDEC
jgi:ribosome-binding protein aMBF1 (putative translation factor)